MKHETPEDRVQRLIDGLLTPDEIALIEGKLFANGGELLLTTQESGSEYRYLPPAPCPAEQIERRKRAVSRLHRRRACQVLVARIEKRQLRFEEITDELQSAAR